MKVKHLLIGATATALLATSAVGVAAQDEPPEPLIHFAGELNHDETDNPSWLEGSYEGVECPAGGKQMDAQVDDLYLGSVLEADDPRISGQFDSVWSTTACWSEQGWPLGIAVEATYRITNEGGSWTGRGPGFISLEVDADEHPSDSFMATLTGSGDYEGMTAIFVRQRETRQDQEPPWVDVVSGIIVDGPVPPPSDFAGSEAARAWMTENAVATEEGSHDDEGFDDDFGGASGVGIVLDEAMWAASDALGGDLEGGVSTTPETTQDFIDGASEDPSEDAASWVERITNALDAIDVAPEDTTFHFGELGRELDDGEYEGQLLLSASRYIGADPEALVEWFHPDNQDGPTYNNARVPGTVAEELQFGEHLVYATYEDGVPTYTLIEGEVVLDIYGPEGPGSYPDEAAVQAFLEALPSLAEIDYEELASEE